MGDFNRENINSYRVPSVTRDNNVNQKPIQRRQPDVKTIQRYVKDPIGVVKFEREPVVTRIPPIRTNNAPERTITSPPVRNDNPPERTVTPPPVRNDNPPPQRTYTPPVRNDNPTVRTNTPPVTKIQGNRNIVRMRVPPTEKQKVDKYSPKVQKEVLVKKKPQTQK